MPFAPLFRRDVGARAMCQGFIQNPCSTWTRSQRTMSQWAKDVCVVNSQRNCRSLWQCGGGGKKLCPFRSTGVCLAGPVFLRTSALVVSNYCSLAVGRMDLWRKRDPLILPVAWNLELKLGKAGLGIFRGPLFRKLGKMPMCVPSAYLVGCGAGHAGRALLQCCTGLIRRFKDSRQDREFCCWGEGGCVGDSDVFVGNLPAGTCLRKVVWSEGPGAFPALGNTAVQAKLAWPIALLLCLEGVSHSNKLAIHVLCFGVLCKTLGTNRLHV